MFRKNVRKRRKRNSFSYWDTLLENVIDLTGDIKHHEFYMSMMASYQLQEFVEIQLCEVKETVFKLS